MFTVTDQKQNVTLANDLGNSATDKECSLSATIELRNKTSGEIWDINNTGPHSDLQTTLNIDSDSSECGFHFSSITLIEEADIWMPLSYVLVIALGTVMNVISVYL